MLFDPDNAIVKLCARGMEMEGKGDSAAALQCYEQAWNKATSHFEKFTAAHYLARQQHEVADKLKWDETALQHALCLENEAIKGSLPSLYLNIAKCHEDLGDEDEALRHYRMALSYGEHLPENDYGNLIRRGIANGMDRVGKRNES